MAVTTTTDVGYYDGIGDAYWAPITAKGSSTALPTYGTPELLGQGMEYTVTPKYREGTLYASNRIQRRKKLIDHYEIKLKLDQIAAAMRTKINGHTVDINGVETVDGDTSLPMGALGLSLTKDDGSKELWWFVQGSFDEPEVSAKTGEDKIEYTNPTISGIFDRRAKDNRVAYVLDTSNTTASSTVVSGWFGKVYDGTGSAA